MKFFNRLKKHCNLETFVVIGLLSATKMLIDNGTEHYIHENSDYILKANVGSTENIYGYDDNRDGNIDRIEKFGIIPSRVGLPIMRIRQTYTLENSEFNFQNKRLALLSKKK